ncbi:hypothetical protein ACFLT9_09555 [Acidobacteriota bacterium]
MKKLMIIFAVLIILAPTLSYADLVSFRVGFFFPTANSDLWQIEFDNLDLTKSDYQASVFGFTYEYFLTNQLSLMFGLESYTKQKVGTYLDYIAEEIGGIYYAFDYGEGFPVSHVFTVSSTPLQVGVKLAPLGRTGKFIPYIGGGVGIYLWNVRLQGDMVDFEAGELFYDPNIDEDVIGYEVYTTDAREENRFAFGYYAVGGFMIPVGSRISIVASFKYDVVKGNFKDAFVGFEAFDLSAYQIIVGINYWF